MIRRGSLLVKLVKPDLIGDLSGDIRLRINTARFALGAVFVYQLILLFRFMQGLDLRLGLKPCFKAG